MAFSEIELAFHLSIAVSGHEWYAMSLGFLHVEAAQFQRIAVR
jgi:hypothetical protein